MTLPPTSYAPVDSRTIGGFCGLRSSSAKAVVPSPANNNAAANGRSRFQSLEWLPAHFIRLLLPAICTGRLKAAPTWHLAKIIAGRTPVGHSYSAAFHQVELRGYRLESDAVEAASRTLKPGIYRRTSADRCAIARAWPRPG